MMMSLQNDVTMSFSPVSNQNLLFANVKQRQGFLLHVEYNHSTF